MNDFLNESPIPTFVINKEHVITYWNRAMELLTGLPAKEMLGTRRQWIVLYTEERPTMADLIVDRASEEVISQYYNTYKKSPLIPGAYVYQACSPLRYHPFLCPLFLELSFFLKPSVITVCSLP